MITILTLTGHIILGLIGVFASLAVVLAIVGRRYNHVLALYSSIIAFTGYMLSWALGGWYYVTYYGSAVKPIIKNGPYPWAHLIVMESKEHIFLMLPILSAVLALLVWLGRGRQRAVAILSILTALIAVFILITGIVISGGVQQ